MSLTTVESGECAKCTRTHKHVNAPGVTQGKCHNDILVWGTSIIIIIIITIYYLFFIIFTYPR